MDDNNVHLSSSTEKPTTIQNEDNKADMKILVNNTFMTHREVVEALINHDPMVTKSFFFEKCRPLFIHIIDKIYDYHVNYDEFVNELYLFLMKPGRNGENAIVLKSFSYQCSLFTWLNTVAIRFFIRNKNHLIDNQSKEYLYIRRQDDSFTKEDENCAPTLFEDDHHMQMHEVTPPMQYDVYDMNSTEAAIQVEQIFDIMRKSNGGKHAKEMERYIYVIKKLEIEGWDVQQVANALGLKKEAVYNVKMRAMKAFRKAGLQQ